MRVEVAGGERNLDGKDDIITGASARGHVKVFNGAATSPAVGAPGELHSFLAYANYTGAVPVGSGDLDGDSVTDIVTGSDINTHVKSFTGPTASQQASFLAYPGFGGPVFVSAGLG